MNDISDVILYALEYARTTFWEFNLFGIHWQMTFLQIWLIPCIAGLSIRIIKHIYEVVNL